MDQVLVTPPPVPTPPSGYNKPPEFHKSNTILVIAYIILGLAGLSILMNFARYAYAPMSSLYSPSLPGILPALFVIFTKNKTTYKIAKAIMILELLILPMFFLFLLIAFFH